MQADPYEHAKSSILALGDEWEAITPNDSADLPRAYKYILNAAATDGTVGCGSRNGVTTTIAVKAGDVLKVRPIRVLATGTATVTLIGIF